MDATTNSGRNCCSMPPCSLACKLTETVTGITGRSNAAQTQPAASWWSGQLSSHPPTPHSITQITIATPNISASNNDIGFRSDRITVVRVALSA